MRSIVEITHEEAEVFISEEIDEGDVISLLKEIALDNDCE
jgi:hypothetical protein